MSQIKIESESVSWWNTGTMRSWHCVALWLLYLYLIYISSVSTRCVQITKTWFQRRVDGYLGDIKRDAEGAEIDTLTTSWVRGNSEGCLTPQSTRGSGGGSWWWGQQIWQLKKS